MKPTLYEKFNTRLQNHRVVAVLILLGSIVIGISTFTDAAKNLTSLFSKPDREEARLKLASLSVPYSAEEFAERAGAGDLTIINLFLAAGMDPNSPVLEGDGPSALFVAARENHRDVVLALLNAGAKVINGRSNGVEAAAQSGNVELLNLLLKQPVDRERLDEAFIMGKNRAVLERLLARGADIKKAGSEALLYAADPGAVDFLVAHGASLNTKNSNGRSVVETLDFDHVNFDTLRILIDRGADLNARDPNGSTLLQAYAGKGYIVGVQMLLAKPITIDAPDSTGRTALSLVSDLKGEKATEIAAILIKAGADVNTKDQAGQSPLSYARRLPHPELVQLLLDHGAKE